MSRVLRGDVRTRGKERLVVLHTERGRSGEARTMVVLARRDAPGAGTLHAIEARDLATVATWPRVGRVRLSLRDGGGYYYAPWKGCYP